MSPKAVDRNAKKQIILEAAMKVFAQKGFAKAKMSEIAVEAAIGKGTIYEYFRSKDQIFQETFHFFVGDMEAVYAQIAEKDIPATEKLTAIIEFTINSFLATGDFGAILMDFWAEGIRNHEQEKMEKVFNLKSVYKIHRDHLSKIIDQGVEQGQFRHLDSACVASVLFGCFDGIMLQYILDPQLLDLKKTAKVLTDLIISGLVRK